MFLLTSVNRFRISTGLKDTIDHKRQIKRLIPGISSRIENFLNRELELKSRTEFFRVIGQNLTYFPLATPITAITTVESDSQGLFNGTESAEVNFHAGQDARSIVLDTQTPVNERGLKIVYTGGLAEHAVNTEMTISGISGGPITVDKFMLGDTSGAFGRVVSESSGTMVIENFYGVFIDGEGLTEFDNDDETTPSGATATLDTVDKASLAETITEIVEACEMEIRYWIDHANNFENSGAERGRSNREDFEKTYDLQPQTRSLLQKHMSLIL